MADKIIAAKLQVDTGSSNANIKEVNKNLADVRQSLDTTSKSAGVTGGAIQGAGGSFGKLKESIGGLPGPLGQAGEGVGKLSTALKALLLNPVGLILAAIVATLALLYKAFTNTFEGAEKVEQVFAGIKATAQALLDNLDKVASAIKNVFTFNFSAAKKDIEEVAKAAADAFNKMAALTKEAQSLAREQSQNDLDQIGRQAKLAQLKEAATDETVPIKERIKLGKQLLVESEKNAKEDTDLAKRTTENKIAQLTLEKDGARKNQIEINKIKGEQQQVEIESANELRAIRKQVSKAEKAEQDEAKAAAKEAAAKDKEARQAAAAEAKEARQKLVEFTNKLTKLQQENELALIKDGYARELKQLEIKIADEKKANALAVVDKKITKQQQAQLDAALDIQTDLQKAVITDKHNQDVAKKEADFQKELAGITGKTKLDAITSDRERERVQLNIGYEQKLQDAIVRYKDDQQKFQQIKEALDAELKAQQDKQDEKNRKEDAKKKFELDLQGQDKIINNKVSPLDAKLAAVTAEQAIIQKGFDDKVLSELDYNSKIESLSNKRKEILDLEEAHRRDQANEAAGTLDKLASIVGKQTVAGKALAIATALINTYQGASEAIKQKSTLPSPFDVIAKVVNVATVIATGLATVKAITAVQVPGGGGGGGGISAPSIPTPAAPLAPQASSTRLDQASLNGIGNAAQPVQAFVVESQGASATERTERLNRAARLGG